VLPALQLRHAKLELVDPVPENLELRLLCELPLCRTTKSW
jgi:hypothetical protein